MGIPVDLNQRTNSICKEGSSRYGEEKTKLVPGARIELATPAFSGRRSTNELPRHISSFSILGTIAGRVNLAFGRRLSLCAPSRQRIARSVRRNFSNFVPQSPTLVP